MKLVELTQAAFVHLTFAEALDELQKFPTGVLDAIIRDEVDPDDRRLFYRDEQRQTRYACNLGQLRSMAKIARALSKAEDATNASWRDIMDLMELTLQQQGERADQLRVAAGGEGFDDAIRRRERDTYAAIKAGIDHLMAQATASDGLHAGLEMARNLVSSMMERPGLNRERADVEPG